MNGASTRYFDHLAEDWIDRYVNNPDMAGRVGRFIDAVGGAPNQTATLLEFGGGGGHIARAFGELGWNVTIADVSQAMLDACTSLCAGDSELQTVLLTPGTPLPFFDARFDMVTASSVMEYVPDPAETLAELSRVLKPGGKLVITAPDERHSVRRRERLQQSILGLPGCAWLIGKTRYMARVDYLINSRNRLSPDVWQSLIKSTGLEPNPTPDCDTPIIMLTAVKNH